MKVLPDPVSICGSSVLAQGKNPVCSYRNNNVLAHAFFKHLKLIGAELEIRSMIMAFKILNCFQFWTVFCFHECDLGP